MDTSESILAVGRLVARARHEVGLSQAALAERAGTTQAVVSRLEAGKVEPSLSTLSRLLLACGQVLQLSTVPWEPDEARQLEESLAMTPGERADRNRRQTALAAKAAAASRAGRRRPLRKP